MDILTAVIELIGKLFIPISAFFTGKKVKENEQLKEENTKLKEYKKIDDREIQSSEVYNAKDWD